MSTDIAADAQDEAELKDTQQTADDAQMAVEELTDAANVLSALRDTATATLAETQDVPRSTVAAVRTGVDMVMGRIGGTPLPTVAMESMDAGCLELTLEAIGDKIKQVWEAVKAAFKKFFDTVVGLFKQKGDRAEKAEAAVDKSIATVKAAAAENTPPPKSEDIKQTNSLAMFTVGNKIPADILTRIQNTLKDLQSSLVDNRATSEHLDQLANIIQHRPIEKLNDPDLVNDVIAFMQGVGNRFQAIKGATASGIPKDQVGSPVFASGLLPGDIVLTATVPHTGQGLANTLASAGVQEWHRGNKPDFTVPNGITFDQLESALVEAKNFLSTMSSYAQGYTPLIKSTGDKIMAAGDNLVGRSTPENEKLIGSLPYQLKKYVTNVIHSQDLVLDYGFKLCGALNGLAAQYAQPAKAAEPAAEAAPAQPAA